jgi:hypothetical protein
VSAETGQRAVHEALASYLDDGEIAIAWTLTIDVAGPDGVRYLAHRSGGGHDGTSAPQLWTALGMLRASTQVAEGQLRDCLEDVDDEEEDAA